MDKKLDLKHGDKILYLDSQNNVHKATVVMKSSFPGAYVVNTGGRYGNPAIVSSENFVGFAKRLKKVV